MRTLDRRRSIYRPTAGRPAHPLGAARSALSLSIRVYVASRCGSASLTAVHRDTVAKEAMPMQVRLHKGRLPTVAVSEGVGLCNQKRYLLAMVGARVNP
jgi:hypothetical protein